MKFHIFLAIFVKLAMASPHSNSARDQQPENGQYKVVKNWRSSTFPFGPASGVALDHSANELVLFHRQDRKLSRDAFGTKYDLRKPSNLTAISSNTIYFVDAGSGQILREWGKDLFYMPHGITVAPNGDIFATDVILHQVFKFPAGSSKPSMRLGVEFEQGKDDSHLCGPSTVAVETSGNFFVSDGYCNSRIIKFTPEGQIIFQIGTTDTPKAFKGSPTGHDPFNIVHDLALIEEKELICAADRENGRIRCFSTTNGTEQFAVTGSEFEGRLFSIAYSSVDGGTLFAVNGPGENIKVKGFVIPLSTKKVSATFSLPCDMGFGIAHGMAATGDGQFVFVSALSEPTAIWKFQKFTPGQASRDDDDDCGQPGDSTGGQNQNSLGNSIGLSPNDGRWMFAIVWRTIIFGILLMN